MLGAIAGDVIGSVYEWHNVRTTDFPLFRAESTFTDDTVLTVATAEALLQGGDYAQAYRSWFRRHPDRGYGDRFRLWAEADGAGPYGSLGNGSAMRVSPVGWAFDSLEEVLAEARRSAAVTHDHPAGIRGAQAVAGAVFLGRTGAGKREIRAFVEDSCGYDLSVPLEALRLTYRFDVTCPGRCPRRCEPSWSRRTLRAPCGSPSPWAETATPWPAWPGPWPRPTAEECPRPSGGRFSPSCRQTSPRGSGASQLASGGGDGVESR